MRITLVIGGLRVGGAERVCINLADTVQVSAKWLAVLGFDKKSAAS
jgi:hypothetical protein